MRLGGLNVLYRLQRLKISRMKEVYYVVLITEKKRKKLLPCSVQQSMQLTKAEKLFFRTTAIRHLILAL